MNSEPTLAWHSSCATTSSAFSVIPRSPASRPATTCAPVSARCCWRRRSSGPRGSTRSRPSSCAPRSEPSCPTPRCASCVWSSSRSRRWPRSRGGSTRSPVGRWKSPPPHQSTSRPRSASPSSQDWPRTGPPRSMTTPTSTWAPKAGPAHHLWRLTAFATSPQARPALLGAMGAVLITAGGLGAGSTRLHDPLLESLHVSWLRFGHGLVLSSVLLWIGVTLMLSAWLWLGRRVIDRTATEYTMVATTGFWLAPLLLSVPVFSRDTYSYLAQGALLRDGLDPYAIAPVDNPNALLDNVSPIWTITTAPYGPAFIMVAKLVTMLVGNNVVAGTMVLRLCMLPGLALLIWAAPRAARHIGTNGAAALWICVLNPLVIIHLMGGVHNEMLMVGLMVAGIALTFGGRQIWGVGLIAVAVAVKATAGLALPFMVWVWMRHLRDARGYRPVKAFAVATAASGMMFVAVFAPVSWLARGGPRRRTPIAGGGGVIHHLLPPRPPGRTRPKG